MSFIFNFRRTPVPTVLREAGVKYPRTPVERPSCTLPPIRGWCLWIVYHLFAFLERFFGSIVFFPLSESLGLDRLRRMEIKTHDVFYPLVHPKSLERTTEDDKLSLEEFLNDPFVSRQKSLVRSLVDKYATGELCPITVARRIIAALEKENKQLRAVCAYNCELIIKQAEESATRYKNKKTLSKLDGIPICVKHSHDICGLPFATKGQDFLGTPTKSSADDIADKDHKLVAKLRSAGLLIIGHTQMTENGLGVFGVNPSKRHGSVRNPFNPLFYAGGSSGGSAAALASGMAILAIGSDGGGSIRIPCGWCGVAGLQPTFGRITSSPTVLGTTSVMGPMATNVTDVAILYDLLAGEDVADSMSMLQPAHAFPRLHHDLSDVQLKGLRIGIDWEWVNILATAEVLHGFQKAVSRLESQGADIVSICLPDVNEMSVGHLISIASESATNTYRSYDTSPSCMDMAHAIIVKYTYSMFRSVDYVQSQRLRGYLMTILAKLFAEDVDVILAPSSGRTALLSHSDDSHHGLLNMEAQLTSMAFSRLTNYLGLPSVAVPVHVTEGNLPVGVQIVGQWWSESLLLRVGLVLEAETLRQSKPMKPQVVVNLLDAEAASN